MRWLMVLILTALPGLAMAQSKTVLPQDLELSVEVTETGYTPFVGEMVLITIKGIYRRHITREKLVQPDFEGFSWSQLGDDTWRDERINGELVKTFRRRMAIYPSKPGALTVGAFTHNLTLTDDSDDWFDHQIMSAPVTIDVVAAPTNEDWWFPTHSLKVSDQWSNAPDQLVPGEGVLRVVRIEALGATAEMIPPMPTLHSPSAMIFPHPEKRFVELSPQGPKAFAYWRWTIRPSNDTSTIVEPLSFTYFDTINRVDRQVTISAQRVAYGSVTPDQDDTATGKMRGASAQLPGWPMATLAALICAGGVFVAQRGHRISGSPALRRFWWADPLALQLRRAARAGHAAEMRSYAAAMLRRDGITARRQALLHQLDLVLFDPKGQPDSIKDFARDFLRASGAGTKDQQPIS
ncbi:Oxygen tolerance [Sulfitobacter marinus]|uniref:Oxygen tolerance n=1 Tax=Sulfitobacter marinus TaxID=394264 RepID=A0A1I6SVR2_9RHOB|nr:BatD family protein [Sulfitobacter marinus]SFS81016.1 Oxygen tolerance [Sulfitobacter marinus]